MPAKSKIKINLLPREGLDSSIFGRILKWALSTFRVMVIVTELVVMGAFLSRFWLDAKNSDLNDELNTKKAQVMAYSDVELAFRANQEKLNIAKSLYAEEKLSEIIDKFTVLIPVDVSLDSFSISQNILTINASSLSEKSIMQFLINLDYDTDLTNVNLSQISTSAENEYVTVFAITADIKESETVKEEE